MSDPVWMKYMKRIDLANGSFYFKIDFPGMTASDVNRVMVAAKKGTEKALKKAGAFIRTSAIRSLRMRKKASAPGSPPSVHSKHKYANLRNIIFAVENSENLVVGPALFKQPKLQTRLPANIHEFGGSVTRLRKLPVVTLRKRAYKPATPTQKANYIRKIKDGSLEKRLVYTYEQATVFYKKRGFMLPALDKERPNFPELWTATVSE